MRALPADVLARLALARGAALPAAPVAPTRPEDAALDYLLFQLGGCGYLLPTEYLIGVMDIEDLRPLPARMPGWAGTLTVRGPSGHGTEARVLPVLDAGALLGGGEPPRTVLALRTPDGPLGLAVPAPEGLQPAPGPLASLAGAPGLLGGHARDQVISLALAPAHLGALRRAGVGRTPDGQTTLQPVSWLSGAGASAVHPAGGVDQRAAAGDLVLVLGERLLADPSHHTALLLRSAPEGQGAELLRVRPQVTRAGELVAGPPGAPCVVGYRGWGRRVVPAVDLNALGLAEAGTRSPYAALLALGTSTPALPVVGAALLITRMRGVHRLESVAAAPPDGPLAGLGTTPLGPVGVLSYPHLLATLLVATNPPETPPASP